MLVFVKLAFQNKSRCFCSQKTKVLKWTVLMKTLITANHTLGSIRIVRNYSEYIGRVLFINDKRSWFFVHKT